MSQSKHDGHTVQTEEVEPGRVVRSEMFHLPEVSGVAIPATIRVPKDDQFEIRGQWFLYLRHHSDGKRKRIALPDTLDLDATGSIWFHPKPAKPLPQTLAGWSSVSRQAWLGGRPAPKPADVFQELCKAVAQYIEFPHEESSGHCATLATWSILTYAYPAWEAVPYLYFSGPAGSGKSRSFEVLERLVFRPLSTSNISGPALFRTLHERGGCVLFDEAEQLKQSNDPATGEVLSMLLAGYRQGGRAMRLERAGDKFQTLEFQVYGPKAMACINGLPPALSSRAITISMFRAPANSPKPRRRIGDYGNQWQHLRDDLHVMALEHGPTWRKLARQSDVVPEGMAGRDYELWQPLLTIANWLEENGASGLHRLLCDHAAWCIDVGRDDAAPNVDAILLRTVYRAVYNSENRTAKDVLLKAQEAEPPTFRNWSARAVSEHLKRYGITTTKTAGRRVYRPTPEEVEQIADVYGIDLEAD